jgi:outer membrane biosynthesis protein TonB
MEFTRNNLWWDPAKSEGPPLGRMGGGGGGRQVDMIALPEASRKPEPVVKVPPPPPPVPVPVVTPVPAPPPSPELPPDTLPKTTGGAVTTGSGGGTGGTSGTGNGPGSGPGTGPGKGGSGTPDSTRAVGRDPEPRQLILIPFDYPPSMRGLTIQVTFFVLADGQVDRVLFSDDIPDRGYAKRLETVMRAYRFRPARSAAGQPVPGHTTVSVTF